MLGGAGRLGGETMNAGRGVLAVVVVWVVRVVLNWLFYGLYMSPRLAAATEQWSGAFREVVPAYIVADLLFVIVFVFLWIKAGRCFGGGVRGGASFGLVVGLLAAVIPGIYFLYSVTYYTMPLWTTECVYHLVAHVLLGVVAAMVYRVPATA
jgi:hypothetical protein